MDNWCKILRHKKSALWGGHLLVSLFSFNHKYRPSGTITSSRSMVVISCAIWLNTLDTVTTVGILLWHLPAFVLIWIMTCSWAFMFLVIRKCTCHKNGVNLRKKMCLLPMDTVMDNWSSGVFSWLMMLFVFLGLYIWMFMTGKRKPSLHAVRLSNWTFSKSGVLLH